MKKTVKKNQLALVWFTETRDTHIIKLNCVKKPNDRKKGAIGQVLWKQPPDKKAKLWEVKVVEIAGNYYSNISKIMSNLFVSFQSVFKFTFICFIINGTLTL